MKKKTTYCLVLLAAACVTLVGCDRSDRYDLQVASETNATAREVKKEVKEAVDATKSYAARGKDEFVASMDRKLTDLDAKIAELGNQAATVKEDAKAESSKALDALREKRVQLGRKFQDLKGSSQEAWQDVKAGFESAYAELDKSYQDVKSRFSK